MSIRPRTTFRLIVLLSMLLSVCWVQAAEYRIAKELKIDTVPSWFPVGFCLLTHDQNQYAAYYNAEHQMVVAKRRLDQEQWQRVILPSKVGWDSHNYITMAMDSEGSLHLAGNMHCVPLIYFRTMTPGDINSFQRLPMTGQEEQRCTYPRFLTDANGQLLFTYRSGSSGNGRRFYNRFDPASKTWTRFLDSPLFDGQDERNAYPVGPARGPDGRFHVVWVWRDTPDCATNHDLSYASSDDLKTWQAANGVVVSVPMTLDQRDLCVDPIPAGGGIINGCQKLSFDSQQRPMIAYHKSDSEGNMQIFVARYEENRWNIRQVTEWDKPISFSGGGAMPFIGVATGRWAVVESGVVGIGYRHRDYGSGWIFLDERTLQPVDGSYSISSIDPRELTRTTIDFPGIRAKLAGDLGTAEVSDTKYVLRWETLDAHRDRPRDPPLPPASTLKLVKLVRVK